MSPAAARPRADVSTKQFNPRLWSVRGSLADHTEPRTPFREVMWLIDVVYMLPI